MKTDPRRWIIAIAFIAIFSSLAVAQQQPPLKSITYRLSMTRSVSHLFEVEIIVELPKELKEKPVQFQMPSWSPGRYAVVNFAQNVQEFRASGPVTRVDSQTWSVAPQGSTKLTVSYKVFGNDLSGTFSQFDSRHANFNGGSIFMYVVDHKPDPVKLTIQPPPGWRIVNGHMDRAGQTEWEFPNWDIMIDTPTEIGPDWTQDNFEVGGKKYHVVVHSFGPEGGKRPMLVKDIEKIVRAQVAMWGPPEFQEYTFILHFAADDHSSDGMEHLNSTQIIETGALDESTIYGYTLDDVAHEFFHVWNVKRLRPQELGPWDFTRPVATRGLWIAEGFTNYYSHLTLRRTGLWDEARFLLSQSRSLARVESAPGSRLMSAEAASLSASFIDNAPRPEQTTNLKNTSISYYAKGETIALVLDLLIRGRTKGKGSLDDVMRDMYEEFYLKRPNSSYYLRGSGYQPEDLERIVSRRSGVDFTDFFKRHIFSTDVLPYDEAFAYVGLRLVKKQANEPYNAGLSIDFANGKPVIQSVVNNSPAENAGLQKNDEIVALAGKPIAEDSWLKTLASFKPGDSVPITIKRDRQKFDANIVLGEPERFEYTIEEKSDATAEEKALRVAWLNGQ